MIVEHAILSVKPGKHAAFEASMREARPLIAESPGFLSLAVHPLHDQIGTYLLLVEWTDVAAHRDGFRASARYQAWRALLHRFYDPMPTISYFEPSII